MYKEKLIFNNGMEIEIESGSSLSDIRIVSETKNDMVTIWELFSDSNLKTAIIQDAGGGLIGEYSNLIFVSETSAIQGDGSILTRFNLRKKTEVELLREEVNALKQGMEINTGAIGDLGEAVSGLAEQGGLI